MRLPTRIHGVLDYTVGALLIALPFLLGFGGGAQTWVPVALGAAAIVYSLFTDYELGVKKPLLSKPRRNLRFPPLRNRCHRSSDGHCFRRSLKNFRSPLAALERPVIRIRHRNNAARGR